jgi:FHA domain/zinc-ribbon domain
MSDHFCNGCGHRNADGANFCSSCGATLVPEGGELTVTLSPDEQGGEDVTVRIDKFAHGHGVLVVRRGSEGADAGETFRLDESVTTAGRSDDSDIFLDDVTVSRRHALFVMTKEGYSVKDAGSLNGTYVNRQLVTERLLANGDEVQIGKFRLVFLVGE